MRGDTETTPLYPIGVAVKLTGLSERRLRYYEKHGLVKPARSTGSHRRYSPADIERLREMKRLRELGFGVRKIRDCLDKGEPGYQGQPHPALPGEVPLPPAAHKYGDVSIYFRLRKGKQ